MTSILFLCILIGCSSHPLFDSNKRSISSSTRDLNKRKSCSQLVTSVLNKVQYKKRSPFKKRHPLSLGQILKRRAALKEKYSHFVDSTKEFNTKAHVPIRGKAKMVLNPEDGFLSKIMMIRKAEATIDLTYYIFKNDNSGKALLHELRLAIKRGVKVRIMYDGLGSVTDAPYLKALTSLRGGFIRDAKGNLTKERAQADAVVFNPLFNISTHVRNWYRMSKNLFLDEADKYPIIAVSMNRRSHDKILMIDALSPENSMAMIGGRNMSDHYYGFSTDGSKTFQDAEMIIKNITHQGEDSTVSNVLNDYYNKIFYYLANKRIERFIFLMTKKRARREYKEMREGARYLFEENDVTSARMAEMQEGNYLDEGFDEGLISITNELQNVTKTKAFLNPLGKHNRRNGDSLVDRFRSEMEKSTNTIDIISPYLWLSDEEISFLKKWAAEDPQRRVRLITSSVNTSDNMVAQAMVDGIFGPKLAEELKDSPVADQIKLYSYGRMDDEDLDGSTAYGTLHAKFTVTDGHTPLVGTSNLDPRSRNLNTEIAVAVDDIAPDSGIASEINSSLDHYVENATEWGSPEWQAIRDHKNNRIKVGLIKFYSKVIDFFGLIPAI